MGAGQVISRLKLRWNGRPGNSVSETTGSFQKLFYLVLLYAVVRFILLIFELIHIDDDINGAQVDGFLVGAVLSDFIHYSFFGLTVYVLVNVRQQVRQRYGIPGHVNEDCVCSCCCPCFVAGQMLRHTTDYDVYPATCCTDRGIPAHAPSIV